LWTDFPDIIVDFINYGIVHLNEINSDIVFISSLSKIKLHVTEVACVQESTCPKFVSCYRQLNVQITFKDHVHGIWLWKRQCL